MTVHSLATHRSLLRRFARDPKGVSAVEFAMVLPFMVALYLGTIELGNGLAVKFKTTLAVRTVTDLASQYVSIDTSTMSLILNAASTVMTPYPTTNITINPTTNMTITLSEITTNASGQGTVTWSCSLGGTARTWAASYTLPTNLQAANITVLLGEVAYPYPPSLGYVITGTVNINQSLYFYPRLSTTIAGPGASVSSCPTS